MWLHIRGVGEWTNTLYSYFQREHERLHNGEVQPFAPSNSSRSNTLESKAMLNTTPQRDFLTKNLARLNHAPMEKASTFDTPPKIEELQACLNGENGPALMHSENEAQKNPFNFTSNFEGSNQPVRPPRSGQTSPKSSPEPMKPATTGGTHAKLTRQASEATSPIRKIQATLQRTFSRKGSDTHDGYANDGFVDDNNKEGTTTAKRKISIKKQPVVPAKAKAPLHKTLSMPDIDNRVKKRERMMAYVLNFIILINNFVVFHA